MAGIGRASAGTATRGAVRMRGVTMAVLLAVSLGLGACSVPEWADPTEWFAGDDTPAPAGTAGQPASAPADARFPNLGRVPPRPVEQTTAGERQQAISSLAADSANAKYTDEQLRARPADSNTPPPAPRQPVSQLPSAAPAQPAAPQQGGAGPVTLQPPAPTAPRPAQQPAPAATGNAVVDTFAQSLAQSSATTLPPNLAQSAAGGQPGAMPGQPGYVAPVAGQPGGSQLLAVIRFSNGDTALGSDDRALVRKVAEYFKGLSGKGQLRVIGYASSRTGDMEASAHRQLNYSLSQKRAEAVAAELRRRGVARASIAAEARADAAPVYYEAMPRAENYNRRVEIYLTN
ncbi:OmpA family protein [Ferrovibrio sp.]|uniref:OmpA family protein n=1 Tax=Ferrovibrio sp. TaxID=1917215 RepID=UPI003512F1E1